MICVTQNVRRYVTRTGAKPFLQERDGLSAAGVKGYRKRRRCLSLCMEWNDSMCCIHDDAKVNCKTRRGTPSKTDGGGGDQKVKDEKSC